jgi:hypothetical protein
MKGGNALPLDLPNDTTATQTLSPRTLAGYGIVECSRTDSAVTPPPIPLPESIQTSPLASVFGAPHKAMPTEFVKTSVMLAGALEHDQLGPTSENDKGTGSRYQGVLRGLEEAVGREETGIGKGITGQDLATFEAIVSEFLIFSGLPSKLILKA